MVRIGAVALIVLSTFLLFGCNETTGNDQTGLDLSFGNCLTFEAWVWLNEDYIGSYSSDVTSFIECGSGSYTVYAKSNIVAGDSCYCWTKTVTVADGKTTPVHLDCVGAGCCKPTASTTSL
jgi:hypothetical protein